MLSEDNWAARAGVWGWEMSLTLAHGEAFCLRYTGNDGEEKTGQRFVSHPVAAPSSGQCT